MKYTIAFALMIFVIVGSYYKGVSDQTAKQTAKYVKELESVQIQNQKLAEQVALKESELTEKAFEYEEAIDGYIANIRTNTIRLRLNPTKASVSKNEPAKCGNNEASEAYLDYRVHEELAICNDRRNKVVFQVNKLQNYIKLNLESVNGQTK